MKYENSYVGFSIFFFLIVAIIVLGTFLIYYQRKEKLEENIRGEEVVITDEMKIDKDKDFIYFGEEEVLDENLHIRIKYPVINLKGERIFSITEKITTYLNEVKSSFTLLEKEAIGENENCIYTETNKVKSAKIVDFEVTRYNQYITLLIYESFYTCENQNAVPSKIQSYTFNSLTGEIVSFDQILEKYNTSYTNMTFMLRSKLEEEIKDNENIQIEETLHLLKDNDSYVMYISENGEFVFKYIVKSRLVDYNDSIVIK